MAEFKLSRDTPATFIHGVTGQEVERAVLPAGTRYDFDGEPNPFQDDAERTQFILVYVDKDNTPSYRYRVLVSDLGGIAI